MTIDTDDATNLAEYVKENPESLGQSKNKKLGWKAKKKKKQLHRMTELLRRRSGKLNSYMQTKE